MTRAQATATSGFVAAVWALLVPVFASCWSPSYSHVSQFISELGARGAAHGDLVSLAGFGPVGFFELGFLWLLRGVLPRSRRVSTALACLGAIGVAYVASAVFPCDPGCPTEGSTSQAIHSFFGLLGYLGASTGLVLLAIALRAAPEWRRLSFVSVAGAAIVALGFAGMLIPALDPVRGVSQRVSELAVFGWIAYVSAIAASRSSAVD